MQWHGYTPSSHFWPVLSPPTEGVPWTTCWRLSPRRIGPKSRPNSSCPEWRGDCTTNRGKSDMGIGILYDSTLCIGCRECEKACAARWKLPYNDNIAAEEQI